MPVQLHAHAAHQRILRQPIELRAHVVDRHIGIADDAVRPAAARPRPRSPRRPRPRTCPSASSPARRPTSRRRCRQGPRGIRRSDSRAGSARRGRRCAAASGRRATACRPAARCDDARRRCRSCGPLAFQASTCAQTAATDEPSARSSTSGRIAFSASVCGVKFGSAASGVSQLTRQARRESRVTASRIAAGSPRSSPSERMSTTAPRE